MILQIMFIVFLIFVNAVLAASEIAFISLSSIKLEKDIKEGNRKAIKIRKVMKDMGKFLATIQIGVTFAGFLASAFVAEMFSEKLLEYFEFLAISESLLKFIIMLIGTIILSYFTLVFGELLPKKIALQHSKKVAYMTVDILSIIERVAFPFVWILTKSTNLFAKIVGIKEKQKESITEEEIRLLIAESRNVNNIEQSEQELIYNVFDFNDKLVKYAMKPIEDVVAISIDTSIKQIIQLTRNYKHTRLPVFENNINKIIGTINVKDIILGHYTNKGMNVGDYLRPPYFVKDTNYIDEAFKEMQQQRHSFAIVRNNQKKVVGIITTEDIVEEIMGNIFDEED